MIHIREGVWQLFVAKEHESAAFRASGVLRSVEVTEPAVAVGRGVRSLVEVIAATGGLRPRALIGGEFCTGPGSQVAFEVHHSGDLGLGSPAACPSLGSGPSLVPGLPQEFAQAVLDGLVRVQCLHSLPAGTLRIDRAGHDEVESSQVAFERAAGILRCVLASDIQNGGQSEDELRALLR
jgi:hypothetical protein